MERLGDVHSRAVRPWARSPTSCRREASSTNRCASDVEDVRALLVSRTNFALNLIERGAGGDREEAARRRR
jgi:hypothetical protein